MRKKRQNHSAEFNSLSDKKLLNEVKAIEKMPDTDKSDIKTLIDAFITKRRVQQLTL
jgi:hypothetical protein